MGDMKSNMQRNEDSNKLGRQRSKSVNTINVPEGEPEYTINAPTRGLDENKSERKRIEKPAKIFGWVCIGLFFIGIMTFAFDDSVNDSQMAKQLLEERVSTITSAGIVLSMSDDDTMTPTDYNIIHNSDEDSTTIWIWDYADEDGDVIRVLVNGEPITENIMIMHKPVELTVPSTGVIQIEGIHDGVGGISYAVRYDINGTTYINTTPEGVCNTYTLGRE